MSFLWRWLFALFLVMATFNPTEWNYIRWVEQNMAEQLSLAVLLGLLLLVCYIIYLRATLRSIGAFGMALVLAIFAASVWVLYDYELLRFDNSDMAVWLGLVGLSLVLGVGLSWSFIRRALSGQYDMEETDE